ncbi:capsular biosynthesis protein [Burkholderia sp. Cy-647]|nr:capsular biosynthesis protein [Burkholderia sp. Tr-860]NIF62343.1 capsular biosynthesis protein [Burkholderia sp. Cy-647]NIF96312.1 capsular biosynthesis protein [Burkholderia sp. Ax-1720]
MNPAPTRRNPGQHALFHAASSGRRPAGHRGPILASRRNNRPALSRFRIADTQDEQQALIRSIDAALGSSSCSLAPAELRRLMSRVVEVDALHVRTRIAPLPVDWHRPSPPPRVLLIDERAKSRIDARAGKRERIDRFRAMADAARAAHPDAEYWTLQSADTGTGRWLSELAHLPADVRKLDVVHSLREAVARVDVVYVLEASEGMGALLAGARVHVFGTPYYAGWGLTDDHIEQPPRTRKPDLANLFDAVFLRTSDYLDPQTHHQGTLDVVLDCIALQHDVAGRYADLAPVAGVAFQWWKRHFATPYLTAGGGALRWTAHGSQVLETECAAIWGGREAPGLEPGVRHVRIEDGFLHSSGLGSDMSPPCSQVIDRLGIYFDATRPNELNVILNTARFDQVELARARRLRESIVRAGLTKYNLGRRAPGWTVPGDKPVVLVPGQVADDASIRLGTGRISTAQALLDEVRARRPDAFVVYKPHPDVMSGNRNGLVEIGRGADLVDTDSDLISLIDRADEVHTLSSLSGFEALLRGKTVHTYGLPFYAGWGLTDDALNQPRRERVLTLDMLVAGVLLRYPVYWDWKLKLFTTPEAIVNQLAPAAGRPIRKLRASRRRHWLKLFRWSRNALRHATWRWREWIHQETYESQP